MPAVWRLIALIEEAAVIGRILRHLGVPTEIPAPRPARIVKTIDPLLARLIATLQTAGAWQNTCVILGSDHGMGQTSASSHPQSARSSWQGFVAFYGPGVKRGARIPYAEAPGVAVMANHFLGLPPLRGHLEDSVPSHVRGTTGTFLKNILEGGPADVEHHRLPDRARARR